MKCSRQFCNNDARSTVEFYNDALEVVVRSFEAETDRQALYLCKKHSAKITTPQGWTLKLEVNLQELEDDSEINTSLSSNQSNANNYNVIAPTQQMGIVEDDDYDDDLTVLMQHVKTNHQSVEDIPKEFQGAKRGNLVALRTGDTDMSLDADLVSRHSREYKD